MGDSKVYRLILTFSLLDKRLWGFQKFGVFSSRHRLPLVDGVSKKLAEPRPLEWYEALDPNYDKNCNLNLACSEQPFEPLGCGELLTYFNIQCDILDFWGEGRIEWEGVVTGFTCSYNVNHQYKLVSPSSDDFNRRIPNRIPTESFANSDIQAYVANDTFPFVTLMGSPIHEVAAREMARVVRRSDGVILLYGIGVTQHIETFDAQAKHIDFYYDPFTSLLSSELDGLETIAIPDHPEYTRAYHRERSIQYNFSELHVCKRSQRFSGTTSYTESSARSGSIITGYSRFGDQFIYESATVTMDNGLVVGVLRPSSTDSSKEWFYAGSEYDFSFVCPNGFCVVKQLIVSDDDGEDMIWYQVARVVMTRARGDKVADCDTRNESVWIHDNRRETHIPQGACLVGQRCKGQRWWYKYATFGVSGVAVANH